MAYLLRFVWVPDNAFCVVNTDHVTGRSGKKYKQDDYVDINDIKELDKVAVDTRALDTGNHITYKVLRTKEELKKHLKSSVPGIGKNKEISKKALKAKLRAELHEMTVKSSSQTHL